MKRIITLALVVLVFLAGGIASAQASDAPTKQSRTLPVLVKVDAKGKVTDIAPAYRVRPAFKHLLMDTLGKMITKPAMHKGKPVESQLVVTLAVLTSKKADGSALTTLKYLDAKPLPPGTWLWTHDAEDRLALTSQAMDVMVKIPLTDMERKANALNAAAAAQRYRPGTGPGSR